MKESPKCIYRYPLVDIKTSGRVSSSVPRLEFALYSSISTDLILQLANLMPPNNNLYDFCPRLAT
jgi:hypothetical protein